MTKTSYGLVIKGDAELQRVEIHFPPTPVSNSYNRITTPTDLIHMVLRLTLFDSRPLKLIACDLALDGGTDEDLAEPPIQLTLHISAHTTPTKPLPKLCPLVAPNFLFQILQA